jgi:DNA-binding NarL/FixJ family response regulator
MNFVEMIGMICAVAAFEPRFSLFCTGLDRLNWWYSIRLDYPDQFVAMQTRILIIEDHVLVREAMALTLAQVGEGGPASRPATPPRRLAMLEADPDCDLLVVDLMLPEINGFSLLGVIAKRFPDVPALVVSALDDRESVQRAMKAGASGFVSKASPSNTLIEAVRTILAGGVFTPEAATGATGQPQPPRQHGLCRAFPAHRRPGAGARAGGPGQVQPGHRRVPRLVRGPSRCMCRPSCGPSG